MLTEYIGRHLQDDPTVFLVGTTFSTQIDFCAEAKAALGKDDCGSPGYGVTVSATYDPSLDKLPDQNERLFADVETDRQNPFYFELQDDIGIYGRWEVTYTDSQTTQVASQIIEIQYPCRNVSFQAIKEPFLSGEFLADFTELA